MTWPSSFQPGTLGYLKDRIDDETKKQGTLSTQIAQCIMDAIAIYQRHRFRFSEGYSGDFNTVIGQEFYTSADNPVIANAFRYDYVALQIGTARFDVPRVPPEEIDLLTQSGTQQGQPQKYSYYNEQIRFYPVPSAVYPVILAAHQLIAGPANDSAAGNRWMTDGERLIRSRAKYELSINYGVDFPNLAQLMHPETGATADAFTELKDRKSVV